MLAAGFMFLGVAEAQARYASVVLDHETGQVLHEVNADTRNYPASLTKMMTLYLLFEALERGEVTMGQRLSVSRRAAGMAPSKLGLLAGETIAVEDAILALITRSANDVAVTVAEGLGGNESRFARKMTDKARALGMSKTTFRNASGLPNRGQLSTARDIAILARALIRDFPQYYDSFATKKFAFKGRTHWNHNRLLGRYEGADGIKTGYIRASGFNLVASAMRNGRRLIAVVFGGKSPRSRDRQVAKLLDQGFTLVVARGIEQPPAPPRRKPELAIALRLEEPSDATPPLLASVTDPAPPLPALMAEDDIELPEMGSAEDPTPDTIWGVQVGAYYGSVAAKRRAEEAARLVPELLDDSRIQITTIKGKRGRIYRSRLGGLTEEQAREACARLESGKIDCLVVQVGARLAQS